jgi:hypothetical protein
MVSGFMVCCTLDSWIVGLGASGLGNVDVFTYGLLVLDFLDSWAFVWVLGVWPIFMDSESLKFWTFDL